MIDTFKAVFWSFYFILCIGIIGAALALVLIIPLYLIGTVWPFAAELADLETVSGIRFLMDLQPWFNADIQLDLPSGGKGCLLVSNHRSHLDAFILLSRVKGIRILAKNSLFYVPFLGLMMKLTKQIPVQRGNAKSYLSAMDRVQTQVQAGEVVHVFPEMTRCSPGLRGTQDFSLAVFKAAMTGGFPVVPIVFSGTDQAWPRSSFRIHFRKPIHVKSLAPLDPKNFSTSDELMRETRQRIQQALLS